MKKIINKVKGFIEKKILDLVDLKVNESKSGLELQLKAINSSFKKIEEDIQYLREKTLTKPERANWLKECLIQHKLFIEYAQQNYSMKLTLIKNLGKEAVFKYGKLNIKVKVIPSYNRRLWEAVLEKMV